MGCHIVLDQDSGSGDDKWLNSFSTSEQSCQDLLVDQMFFGVVHV